MLLAYIIGGAAVFIVMRALGEMVVRHPVSGSFAQFASRYIHPFAGFLVGWTFTFEMFLVAVFDATAIGFYMRFWYPEVSRWVWVLAVVFFIAAINLIGVKVFGELEFWFSLIKIVAIIALIMAGIGIILFGFGANGHENMGVHNLVEHEGFMPHGVWGVMASFTIVMFAFGGIEIIGVTAGEAQNPKRVLPKSFTRTTRNGVPIMTVITMVIGLLVGVVINYFYPDQVIFLLGALATFATVTVWLVILVSHIRMKREIARQGRLPSEFPIPFWPITSVLTIAFMIFVIVMVGVVPGSRPALWVGLVWVAILTVCYFIFVKGRGRQPHQLVDQTEPITVVQ